MTYFLTNTFYRLSNSAISSKLLPFVSGITVMIKMAPIIEQTEKKNMQPCIPIKSAISVKYLTRMKAELQIMLMQNDAPMSFICLEAISSYSTR